MPARRSRRARPAFGVAMSLIGLVASITMLGACSRNQRTALAIGEARWHGNSAVVLTTECATDLDAEVGPDRSGTGLTEITLWGSPSIGTCRPSLSVSVHADTTHIVDGATSMVVELPTRT